MSFGNMEECCDGSWRSCHWFSSQWHCPCVDSSSIIDETYHFTSDYRLYTEYVTLGKFNGKSYAVDKRIHSSELQLGDKIMWPGFDLGVYRTDGNVIMSVESLNITTSHSKCCASISIGFPRICQVKFCCGTGCCC